MADPHTAPDAHDAYVRGSQHIDEQAATFSLFLKLAKWGSLLVAAGVLHLVMWFQPGGSFFAGAVSAFALLVVGFFALRSKKTAH